MRTLILGLATMVLATVFGDGYITSVQLPNGETKQIRDEVTANSLTNYATRADMDKGWWSEWTYYDSEGQQIIIGGESSEVSAINMVYSNDTWKVTITSITGNVYVETASGTRDDDKVEFDGGLFTLTATRHRVAAPVPTKPSDIGAQEALSSQQIANIAAVPNKYTKPSGGIPKADMSNEVQDALDLAGTALQEHQSLTNYYTKSETDYAINLLAAYYITMNEEGNPFPTYAALTNATTYYSGGEPRTPTRNDYAVVLADETHNTNEWRYIYTVSVVGGVTNSQWDAQYPIETNDYEALANKPSIDGIELSGNKTAAELGLATDSYVNNLDTSYRRFYGITNINQTVQYFTTSEGDGITNLVVQLPAEGETKDWVVYVNAAAELKLTLPRVTWWASDMSYTNNIASNTPTALFFTQVTTNIYMLGRKELYSFQPPPPVVVETPTEE